MLDPETFTTPFHDWLVDLRRYFHQHPEPAYAEAKTAARIAEVLRELEVSFQTGIGGTGVVARLEARRPGPRLLFRADMDALPLEEAGDGPYRSRHPGMMHACGHDAHVTIALGLIRRLVEADWPVEGAGCMDFFFQPAEEGGAGAKAMLDTGILDGVTVDAVFAGHVQPELPVGSVGLSSGVSNAASDTFKIRIEGKGGHGAHPHQCADPVTAGAYLVTQLQSIVSRSRPPLEPLVITVGQFHAGTASNIIPGEASLEGTLRTLSPEMRQKAIQRLEEMAAGLKTSLQCSADVQIHQGYPVLVNDPELARWSMDRLQAFLGADRVHQEPPRMGAEDFAYFLQRYPGVMLRLGCSSPQDPAPHGLHSPHFDLDEGTLDVGVEVFAHLLTQYAQLPPG